MDVSVSTSEGVTEQIGAGRGIETGGFFRFRKPAEKSDLVVTVAFGIRRPLAGPLISPALRHAAIAAEWAGAGGRAAKSARELFEPRRRFLDACCSCALLDEGVEPGR